VHEAINPQMIFWIQSVGIEGKLELLDIGHCSFQKGHVWCCTHELEVQECWKSFLKDDVVHFLSVHRERESSE